MKLEIKGKSYKVKGYTDFIGDMRRIGENLKRATESPEQFNRAARANLAIICPLATRELKTMNDYEVMVTTVQFFAYMSEISIAIHQVFEPMGPTMAEIVKQIERTVAEIDAAKVKLNG